MGHDDPRIYGRWLHGLSSEGQAGRFSIRLRSFLIDDEKGPPSGGSFLHPAMIPINLGPPQTA
jgi:hypothetical protein